MKTLVGFGPLLMALCGLFTQIAAANTRLINGKPVDPGTWKEVIRIRSDGAGCTATVVGPKAIITAAHCAKTGGTATFTLDGKDYSAVMTRFGGYPGQDLDVSIGLVTPEITGVTPATIGGTPSVGLGITLLGYGCVNAGGGGGNDGILRIGDSAIVEFSSFDMVSKKAGGAALCFGDSGGPAFVVNGAKKTLLGINSKGNIQDTNYNANLDHAESKKFLTKWTGDNNAQICGVNLQCGGVDPVDPAPTCTLSANPSTFKVGESTTLAIIGSGKITAARINGKSVTFPTGTVTEVGNAAGNFTAQAEVVGPGGTGTCSASYTVQGGGPGPTAPSCTLTATPQNVKKGETVTLEINVTGQANSAAIDGTPVSVPTGKKMLQPNNTGVFTASASATGNGGTGSCSATYEVSEGTDPVDPTAPNFAIIDSYCGANTLSTKVTKVCLGVVKKDASVGSLRLTQVISITYFDNNGVQVTERLPVIAVAPRAQQAGETSTKEDITMYTNTMIAAANYAVMDTRKGILTRFGTTPIALEGRNSTGQYFIVDLKLPGVVLTPKPIASRWSLY